MDQKAFLNKIKAKVLKEDAGASLILFGSRARGDFREDSDWDLLVLTSKALDYKWKRKIRDDIYDVELEFEEPVSTIILEREKWNSYSYTPLYGNVIHDGREL
ncbi:MAG TPA: nucleotidyltransferase domain-containing protein [Segetibacter sp.]|jgi:predicted nucleotidyltransferase